MKLQDPEQRRTNQTVTTVEGETPGSTVAAGDGDGDDGGVNWVLIGGIAVVVVGGALLLSRRKSEDERE